MLSVAGKQCRNGEKKDSAVIEEIVRKECERERNAAALRAAEDEAARAQGTVAALKGKLQ